MCVQGSSSHSADGPPQPALLSFRLVHNQGGSWNGGVRVKLQGVHARMGLNIPELKGDRMFHPCLMTLTSDLVRSTMQLSKVRKLKHDGAAAEDPLTLTAMMRFQTSLTVAPTVTPSDISRVFAADCMCLSHSGEASYTLYDITGRTCVPPLRVLVSVTPPSLRAGTVLAQGLRQHNAQRFRS